MAMAVQSELLKALMEHAKTVGGKTVRTVTVERFVLAALEAVEGKLSLPAGTSADALKKLFDEAGFQASDGTVILREYIGNSTMGALDEFLMSTHMRKAQEAANEAEKEFVTAEDVLDRILKRPSETVRRCCEKKEEGAAEPKAAPQAEGEKKLPSQDGTPSQPSQPTQEETATPVQPEETPMEPSQARREIAALTERVKDIHKQLTDTLFGQDNAISVFTSGYFQAELLALTDRKRTRPAATYLFAGPPGVGKTFLAESAAKVLGLPFQRFDMSEYCDKEASIEFCGSDKVYRNGKAGNFTSFVSKNRKCVVLFDEIEKAHISIIHLFLQILDAGRIRDNYTDEEIPLRDVIMIFTTNAGRQLYAESESGDFSSVTRKVILKALQKDVDPRTGIPYFPEAICSRFASGNVVMFNHISAQNLRQIARRELCRHAENFSRDVGVKFDIDEHVYSALLFAEGGAADARTVRARAESFFDDELFELFRLTAGGAVDTIEDIRITVDLPHNDVDVLTLFEAQEKKTVLLFASEATAAKVAGASDECTFVRVGSPAEADAYVRKHDVHAFLIDLDEGRRENTEGYLNIEDVDSQARDFFHYVKVKYGELPVYLFSSERELDTEEKGSFTKQGARGFMAVNDLASFKEEMTALCRSLHQQQMMSELARANKLVTFETAQRLSADGKHAEIRLFDFHLMTALDAEDAGNVLSNVSKPNVRWDHVIGAEDAKKELKYFVEYLKNPKKYLGTGVRPPKGILLYGPPGTGKTMLAKAMAGESDVTFISAEGNQFLQRYVGQGSEKVHELFRTARKYAPSILFIDEIDAIAKERTGANSSEDTLTAFLTEMDGFKNDPGKPVFVLAATNFDVEPGGPKSLDPALMRRFDRRVYIDLPNRDDRVKYIRMKLAANPTYVISEEKIANLAVRSTGMSLAEIESVLELSLRTAIRDGGVQVTDEVLDEAFETFGSGEKKQWDAALLERVARHEAGHTFLCWYGGENPSYVTVVARGNHGGYMRHDDNEGKALYTREEMLARIRTSLGGRAAELVYYGEEDGISTGASGDLSTATKLAQYMLCTCGMDADFGLAVVDADKARTNDDVRAAVNALLNEELQRSVALIREHRGTMDRLVEQLIAKNHLSGDEVQAILSAGVKR